MNPNHLTAAAARYQGGASLKAIGDGLAVDPNTLRNHLARAGVEIRPRGKLPKPKGTHDPAHSPSAPAKLEPRYSCGHRMESRAVLCRICDTCQCPPSKRLPVRMYMGHWLDRMCEKLVG